MNVVEQASGFLGCRHCRTKLHFGLALLGRWLAFVIERWTYFNIDCRSKVSSVANQILLYYCQRDSLTAKMIGLL
jgi:hypothetical protein